MKYRLIFILVGLLIISLAICGSSVCWTEEQLIGEIVIPGTGDSQQMLREMAARYEEVHPFTTIGVPDSIGSSGGIKAVGNGMADMARVARSIKEKEKRYGLTHRVFARSPIVFVVHPSVKGLDNLTVDQINGIYSGKITNWQQIGGSSNKIYPIMREPGDSSRTQIERCIPGFKEIANPVGKVYYTTPEAIAAIQDHTDTIGFVPMAMIMNTRLKILRLDGIHPSIENLENGGYPLVTHLGMVYKEERLEPLAKAFLAFIYTQEGRTIVRKYGCLPVDRID